MTRLQKHALGIAAGALFVAWQSFPTQPVYACIAAVIGLVVVVACRASFNPAIGKDS